MPGRKPPGSLPFPQTLPFPAADKNGSGSASIHNLLSWLKVLGILLESVFGILCGNLECWRNLLKLCTNLYQVKGQWWLQWEEDATGIEGAALSMKCHVYLPHLAAKAIDCKGWIRNPSPPFAGERGKFCTHPLSPNESVFWISFNLYLILKYLISQRWLTFSQKLNSCTLYNVYCCPCVVKA